MKYYLLNADNYLNSKLGNLNEYKVQYWQQASANFIATSRSILKCLWTLQC